MADFERREYDTRQHFPEQKRTDEFLYPFGGLLDLFRAPDEAYKQIKWRIQNFREREKNPKDTNKYCWPVCPCGVQISRNDDEYPYGFNLIGGLPLPIGEVLNATENG
jgi:hypothetical protein